VFLFSLKHWAVVREILAGIILFLSWSFPWHLMQARFRAALLWLNGNLPLHLMESYVPFPSHSKKINYILLIKELSFNNWAVSISWQQNWPSLVRVCRAYMENQLVSSSLADLPHYASQQELIELKKKNVLDHTVTVLIHPGLIT